MKLVFWVWFRWFCQGVLTAMLLFVVFFQRMLQRWSLPRRTITRPEAPAFDCAVRAWEDTVGPLDYDLPCPALQRGDLADRRYPTDPGALRGEAEHDLRLHHDPR